MPTTSSPFCGHLMTRLVLGALCAALLDHLGIAKAELVAHSTGGMVAVRIARAHPDRVAHLVLTAPIGLEDYRLSVPPVPTEKLIETEDRLTAEGYRKQLETNYALK